MSWALFHRANFNWIMFNIESYFTLFLAPKIIAQDNCRNIHAYYIIGTQTS